MEAHDPAVLGPALHATMTRSGDGSITGSILASTPVAIAGILAFTALGLSAILTQDQRRPQDPQPVLADGDGDGGLLNA